MAQGMWTKRYTSEGTAFYYNATLNKSEWTPPHNSITHDADNLQIPREDEQLKRKLLSTTSTGESKATLQHENKKPQVQVQVQAQVPADTGTSAGVDRTGTNYNSEHSNTSSSTTTHDQAEAAAIQLLSSVLPQTQSLPNQHQQQPSRQHRSKRFKTTDKSSDDPQAEESSQSSYHQLVNTYQAMTGKEKGDEGGKWLVR